MIVIVVANPLGLALLLEPAIYIAALLKREVVGTVHCSQSWGWGDIAKPNVLAPYEVIGSGQVFSGAIVNRTGNENLVDAELTKQCLHQLKCEAGNVRVLDTLDEVRVL